MNWLDHPVLRLHVVDSDDISDDVIGDVFIYNSDLEAALADGQLHAVDVRSQSSGQLVTVVIAVSPEGWTYSAPDS